MSKVIIIGGGWAGCAAAISAKKAGASVTILERTDLLLGLGNVGGIMRNNGRYTATEEAIVLGAKELFELTDKYSTHKDIDFPGHKHATIYNVTKIEKPVRDMILDMGIEVRFFSRVVDVELEDNNIKKVILEDGEKLEADAFVETTGSSGPMGNCTKYGNGCAMCVLRCPAFGGRVSITSRCEIEDMIGQRKNDEYGAFSGSMKLLKESLSEEIQKQLNENGCSVVPLPDELVNAEKLDIKVCQQYNLPEFSENVVLIDTGHAKLMAPFYNLEKLRSIPGFENAIIVDPYAGGKANSIRYLSVAPRDNYMRAKGIGNLFVAGEKSGFYVGHTEAICTGSLAGHNAARKSIGMYLLQLPDNILIGDFISYSNKKMSQEGGKKLRFTFAGSLYFKRMNELGFYTTDKDLISERVKKSGLEGVFDKKVIKSVNCTL
ncbi:FAD-dependent oxidoreductase [Asaccharospora irregularis]|uniref:Glucose inhibited division protein A n=1 Tax=Asaccharospora irregularis DSM 2635 TaxID=1121321 RepID=A0A1M5K838_9FIRM|nr:FAD-dependent oxidoreductase [Asaccharospora irregularis]SHG48629.1 Glucose inhibited division protein A [Asaccharospora irregularis DSM 2635]